MSSPGGLYRPYSRLVKIEISGKSFEVPENNTLLRCMQFLAPEHVAYGRFCWNEDCQYCRIQFDLGQGSEKRVGLACKIMVQDGLRVLGYAHEIKYCLRSLNLKD